MRFVIYHPVTGFLVDEDGAWSERRDEAKAHRHYEDCETTLEAAIGNGLEKAVAIACRILEWW